MLAAKITNDANNTSTYVAYDALGLPAHRVNRGNSQLKGDEPLIDDPKQAGPEGNDRDNPGIRFEYHLLAFENSKRPVSSKKFVRLFYGSSRFDVSLGVTHYGGSGAAVQSKRRISQSKFRSNGRTVVNNMGAAVMTFDAFESRLSCSVQRRRNPKSTRLSALVQMPSL